MRMSCSIHNANPPVHNKIAEFDKQFIVTAKNICSILYIIVTVSALTTLGANCWFCNFHQKFITLGAACPRVPVVHLLEGLCFGWLRCIYVCVCVRV